MNSSGSEAQLVVRQVRASLASGDVDEAFTALAPLCDDAQEDPELWYLLAEIHFRKGEREGLVRCCRRVLVLQPEHEGALFNLGGALLVSGNLLEAERCFRRLTELRPDHSEAFDQLGQILEQGGRMADAMACYQQAIAGSGVTAGHHRHLGLAYLKDRQLENAEKQFLRGLDLDSSDARAFVELGRVQSELGKLDAAVDAFKRALAINPQLNYAHFWLAAINDRPETDAAKRRFVSRLFDGHAEDFDRILVNDLGYRTPWLMAEMLSGQVDAGARLDILDLGCGTGLCADTLRHVASVMVGVDLSAGMLQRAEKRGYTQLLQGDIVDVMRAQSRSFDLIVAADVFVYVGALEAVFHECRRLLSDGGLMVFSTETADGDEGYMLRASGRYAHSRAYINGLARHHGFTGLKFETCMLRREAGRGIGGDLFLLQKS